MFSKLSFNNMKGKMLLFFISTNPIAAIAHTGHDHGSQWANLIHLLWILPMVITPFIAIKLANKKSNTKKIR